MEKRIQINDFNEVDGVHLTLEQRINELADGLTSSDTFIMDTQKFKNTKEGRRRLADYIVERYGNKSNASPAVIAKSIGVGTIATVALGYISGVFSSDFFELGGGESIGFAIAIWVGLSYLCYTYFRRQ